MFERWEERTLPWEVGHTLLVEEKAILVSVSEDKSTMTVKVKKGIVKENQSETDRKEEEVTEISLHEAPKRVAWQIEKDMDDKGVIIAKGKRGKKKGFLTKTIDGEKRRFYPDHILRVKTPYRDWLGRMRENTRYLIRWGIHGSESYDAEGERKWSQPLENLLRNDRKRQLIKAVPSVAGLTIDRTILSILILAMVFGIPIGLSFNDIFHWVPNTVIHWIPRT